MPSYPSIYRAKAVKFEAPALTAFVPQVFGDVPIEIVQFNGPPPTTLVMGWVAFQGGNPEFPVWLASGGGGGGGTVSDVVWVDPEAPTDPNIELWWDTNEPSFDQAAADLRYVNTAGDTMSGALVVPSLQANYINAPGGAIDSLLVRSSQAAPAAAAELTRKDYVDQFAKGIVAQFPRLTTVNIATQAAVTGNLNFTFLNGRRYRLVCYIRALQVAAAQAGSMVLYSGTTSLTGTYGGSAHFSVGPPYGYAYGEWIIDGTGQAHSNLHFEAVCPTATAHMTANSQHYIEDVGPVR